mgnify:FL=1
MDYFYFFFFLSLSVIILFKSIIKSISDWIMKSEKLNKTGLITFIIGISLTCFSLMQSLWYERLWMVVTLILGILLLIRSFFIIFFLKNIKKMLPILLKHYYKISLPISVTMIFLAFLIVSTDYIGPKRDISNCESDESISVICNFQNPEDIVITPDNKYLFISEFGGVQPFEEHKPGYFAFLEIDTNTKIIPNIKIENNEWGSPNCERKQEDQYGPHGIDLIKRNDGRFQIAVINHYPNETIEMFELIKNNEWSIIWRGCIDVPEKYYFNDVSLKKNGDLFASHMYQRNITLNKWLIQSILKINTGYLVKWNQKEFVKIHNSEGSGPNGIAFNEDSNIIYINYNKGDKLVKFDLNKLEKIASYNVESPDNPYIANNSIWVTSLDAKANDLRDCTVGKNCSAPFSIYELDKSSLSLQNKYSFSKTVFGLPTVAVPINKKLYIGSFRSDRIGVININE